MRWMRDILAKKAETLAHGMRVVLGGAALMKPCERENAGQEPAMVDHREVRTPASGLAATIIQAEVNQSTSL